MPRLVKKASVKSGLQPGTLIHVGEKKIDTVKITVLDYDENTCVEREFQDVEECLKFTDKPTVSWINIDGLHDTEIINRIGGHFGIHPLVLEDILNTDKRPEIDDYVDYIYIILKMIYIDPEEDQINAEQVSLLLCKNTVISFQEGAGDPFEFIRERIRGGKGRIRKSGADYLAYALADAVVDNYYIVLEEMGELIEEIEDELIEEPDQDTLREIYELKREMLYLRKYIWPLREVVHKLQISESPLIDSNTKVYIRDLYSHAIQITDTAESYREMITGMLETYLSVASNRMNEVMKMLTIIASIFIPLTFVAGLYGMNFEYMPELHHRWGYPGIIVLMLLIATGMIYYFKRRKWL